MTKKNLSMPRKSGLLFSQRSLQRGAISLLTVISLPLIFGILVLSVDVSYALSMKSNMQGAADNAARSAAELRSIEGSTYAMVLKEARAVAAANGYVHGTNASVNVNLFPNITTGNFTSAANAVEVLISSTSTPFFGSMMSLVVGQVGVRAVSDWDSAPCLVALNPANSGSSGIQIGGNTTLTAECGVVSNNSSMTASVTVGGSGGKLTASTLRMGGNTVDPLIDAPNRVIGVQTPNPFQAVVDTLPTQFGYDTTRTVRGNTTTTYGVLSKDPTATQQSVSTTCATTYTGTANDRPGIWTSPATGTSTLVLSPGYYASGIQVKAIMCDSRSTKYNLTDVKMLPGNYFLDDTAPGGFNQSELSLVGNNVAIVLMNTADFSMVGGKIELSNYLDGAYPNVTVIGNTNTSGFAGFTSNTIERASLTGSFVMPRKDFKVAGNVTFAPNKCLLFVGWYLQLNSSGNLGGGCTSSRMNLTMLRGPRLRE